MLNYVLLTQQQYVDLLLNRISSEEGPAAIRYQNPGDHRKIKGVGSLCFAAIPVSCLFDCLAGLRACNAFV